MLLLEWSNSNQFRLTEELKSKSYLSYLSQLSSSLGVLFFIIGFFVGLGLLSYSGEAPVNIIYYLLIVIALPIFSMTLSLFSMYNSGKFANFFNNFFPLHWIEKIYLALPFTKKLDLPETPLPPKLSKWIFMERMQLLSLIFSIGLLISLLLMVLVKDIAFSWSTTLQVSPEEFQAFLAFIAIFWDGFFSSAVPSLELVEASHFFRLGARIDYEMIHNANMLGAWWKFLAMSTIVYAIFFRFIVWLIVKYAFNRELKKELLLLDGVHKIQREFETAFVSTKAPKEEKHLEIIEETEEQVSQSSYRTYSYIFAWNFSEDEILLINDAKEIRGEFAYSLGGDYSFDEDEERVENATGMTLIYVKSWEPPTMDFIDLLEILIENGKVDEVQLYPLGTVGRYYESDATDIAVWKRKIQGLKSKKVWVIDETE